MEPGASPGDDGAGHGSAARASPEGKELCPGDRAGGGHALAADAESAPPAAATHTASAPSSAVGAEGAEAMQVSQGIPVIVGVPPASSRKDSAMSIKEWSGLPSDFRVQLQIFDEVSRQAQLLDCLAKQQGHVAEQVACMQQQVMAQQHLLQSHTLPEVASVRQELAEVRASQAMLIDAVNGYTHPVAGFLSVKSSQGSLATCADEFRSVISGSDVCSPSQVDLRASTDDDAGGLVDSPEAALAGTCLDTPTEQLRPPEPSVGARRARTADLIDSPMSSRDLMQSERNKRWWVKARMYFKEGRGNKLMEGLCATVIVMNAISIGVKADIAARAEVGGQPTATGLAVFLSRLERVFVVFYTLEFAFKCWLFRKAMLFGPDWKWNWFDLLLLLLAYFEDVANAAKLEENGVDVTWMRLLRLLKMMKMLRVVRVMRFFKELRTMLSSIIGSVATLMWSLLMIFLITYIFGLIFLQAVVGFLEVNEVPDLDEETWENIQKYWNGVPQAVITLYMAVTGGSDWEPLAQPFQAMPDSGTLYYIIFLLYIAFSTIAVLNVLTGMFVDAAMKVAVVDESNVLEEILEKYGPQLESFRLYLMSNDDGFGNISWPTLKKLIQTRAVKDFLKVLEMDPMDMARIYNNLSHDGVVNIEEFLAACAKCRADTRDIELLGMQADFKRYEQQLGHMMEYVEERFNEVHGVFNSWGATPSTVKPLRNRLAASSALPRTWAEGSSSQGSELCDSNVTKSLSV